MKKDSLLKSRRDVLKLFDLEHLNDEELQLLSERKLDKKTMLWTVLHLSECRECCHLASVLTAQEIKDALTDTSYDKPEFIQQTVDYYFQTLAKAKKSSPK